LAERRDDNGALLFRIGRIRGRPSAEWPNVATLTFDAKSRARYVASADASQEQITSVKQGLGRAMVHQARGGLSLHGATVAWKGHAVVFVGASGAGKSTLAAYLCARDAFLFVADDSTMFARSSRPGALEVLPSREAHSLTRAAARAVDAPARTAGRGKDKIDVRPRRRATRPLPLAAIFVLRFDARLRGPRVRRLSGTSLALRLMQQSIRLVLDEGRSLRTELEWIERIASTTPVYELARPKQFGQLDGTRALVTEKMAARASTRTDAFANHSGK
jgi:hypothetical protein